MLPQEWPLARMSVWMRHVSVLLRVTLYRRLAELSFRGVAFHELPSEVMREVHRDFDGVCGAMADQLASLFAFLKPDQSGEARDDLTGLALYAEPAFWRYGQLSFCAKTCESKTIEVGGTPATIANQDGTPALETSRNALSLMQTVVISFGRNQYLGKPDLPINQAHVYFPVQLVHKLVERCCALGLQDVTPEEGKRYKHNSAQNLTNNPYIIVSQTTTLQSHLHQN